MASDKYAALDAAILSAIGAGPQTFAALMASSVGDEAREHETCERPDFRVLDARLQALRNGGKIKVDGRRRIWVLAQDGGAA